MKIKTLKSLKAERETLLHMLSDATSEQAKEYIINEVELLNFKIEERSKTKQSLIDMTCFVVGSTLATLYISKGKK